MVLLQEMSALEADYWVFDPVNLAEPWYTRQSWTELANDDNFLRLRYWDCCENQNNDILEKSDGTSQFRPTIPGLCSTAAMTGVVKEFQYTNPHSWLLVDVTNSDGTITTWGFEAEGPSSLMRAGIRKNDLPPWYANHHSRQSRERWSQCQHLDRCWGGR